MKTTTVVKQKLTVVAVAASSLSKVGWLVGWRLTALSHENGNITP